MDYSDTMKFITEYLSLIIHDADYYKDDDTIDLIDKLAGSRLAILDYTGHCELIGSGWERCEGVWYSNGSYKEPVVTPKSDTESAGTTTSVAKLLSDDYWTNWYEERYGKGFDDFEYKDPYDPYSDYLDENGLYDFSQTDCPATLDNDDSYCADCKQLCECWNINTIKEIS